MLMTNARLLSLVEKAQNSGAQRLGYLMVSLSYAKLPSGSH